MGAPKINYKEGDCFVLPLRRGGDDHQSLVGYARGVVARLDGKGVILAYFYGPRLPSEADAHVDDEITPGNAALIRVCGDLGVLNGEWRVIGAVKPWRPADWPVPAFSYLDEGSGTWWLRHYDEVTLDFYYEETATAQEAARFPRDGMSGYVAAEIRLGKVLTM